MNEIKTLKDIMFDFRVAEFFMAHNIQPDISGDICAKIQLLQRQEAIKWIKELRSNPNLYVDQYSEWVEGNIKPDSYLVINWIKHFFNITI